MLRALKSPRYAGAFAFGRTRQRRSPGGGAECRRRPREEWDVLLIDAHPGYISWERFEANQRQLADVRGHLRRRSPGAAAGGTGAAAGARRLRRLRPAHDRALPQPAGAGRVPDYLCQAQTDRDGNRSLPADPRSRDRPRRRRTAGRTRLPHDARNRGAGSGRTRGPRRPGRRPASPEGRSAPARRPTWPADASLRADPDNRLVAAALEADWNARLAEEREALEDLERRRDADHNQLTEAQRRKIFQLAADFPRLWNDPQDTRPTKKSAWPGCSWRMSP